MIVIDDASVVSEDGAHLLDRVSLTIGEQMTAVIGANGSGKTTFARLLNGLTAPTSGSVRVDDRDTVSERSAVQRQVGFVFQDADHQLVYPTPIEDVALGLRARGARKGEALARAEATLVDLGLERVARQAIHTLSGGEKHLVALAGVVALDPTWIVLDEPTTSLDLINRRRVVDTLLTLSARLVVVSHDLDLVGDLDRAILLDHGEVVADGPPSAVIERYVAQVGAR